MTEVIAMDDDQKDVAIIEASALLVTLIFIVLSFYSSNYALYYTMLQQECSSNPKGCVWPPWLAALSAQVGTLEPYTYSVGFFFVVAALAATIRLFKMASPWALAGLRNIEFAFFFMGLFSLAVVFFSKAPRDVNAFALLAVITLLLIGMPLAYAYYRRQWRVEPS